MNYSIIPVTLISNPSGIINSLFYFSLDKILQSNTRIYFYKYNIQDLVEVEVSNGIITIYRFNGNTPDGSERVIIDELEFYHGYFNSAGLNKKRFIFDCKNKLPVTYDDFTEMENISSMIQQKSFLFILDKKHGYITEKDVFAFATVMNSSDLDTCNISFANDLINIIKCKSKLMMTAQTLTVLTLISGMLSGIKESSIKDKISGLGLKEHFLEPVDGVEINSDYIEKKTKGFKFDKLIEIIKSDKNSILEGEIVEKVFDKKEVYLRDIMDIGLDKFMKTIKDSRKVVRVVIDAEWNNIISMYIVQGAAFITPGANKQIHYFYDLFDSDNVNFVMN